MYIPHVFADIPKEFVADILEKRYNLGTLKKIECIPKVNQKDGHNYYCCYVFFEFWTQDANAVKIMSRLNQGLMTKLKYDGEKYWQLLLNISEIAFWEDPKHMDLVLYLHPDFRKETIASVLEALDIGKVNSIEIENSCEIDSYQSPVMWSFANPKMWNEKIGVKYNTVKVRFDFWYRTKTAYTFQNSLYLHTFIDIPVFENIIWTFYQEKPLFEGINPNLWTQKIISVDL
jgi:hypothetical protein